MQQELNQLIANSYQLSARRVMLSLNGGLAVRNSREPANPPAGVDRVIGLCGQGGRHPYFELSLQQVQRTIQEILAGPPELDLVHSACEQLRTLTSFNAATGCVNDSKPTLVPFMPPEEIWCNGTEVALDLWRLIAFDIDYVSSAAQLGFDPTDMAIGSLSYNAVAFSKLVNACGNDIVSFDVKEFDFPKPLSSSSSSSLTVSLKQLFLEAGSLLTPADPADMAQWYAAVRYLNWIDAARGDLRVNAAFSGDSVDTRYRGLFSEEMAIGMMASLLRERYGVSMIANTAEYHALHGISHDGVVADFIAEGIAPTTGKRMTIIAESKGAIRQKVPANRKTHAKSQISATPYSVSGTDEVVGLAFASSLRYSNQNDRSYCEVIDPEPNDDGVSIDPVSGYRLAYAKTLRFAGLETAARQTYQGRPATALPDPDLEKERMARDDRQAQVSRHRSAFCREALGAELIRDMGETGLIIERRLLSILRNGISSESVGQIREQLAERRRNIDTPTSFLNGLGIGLASFGDENV